MTYSYWQHFLTLEADFSATARYVEFAESNYRTHSVEYAKLLLAIGSEVDVLCKIICSKIDPAARRDNVHDYRMCLTARTAIATEEVFIRRYGLTFSPWVSWAGGSSPGWWQSYNRVKHQRDQFFAEANLGNCANAIAGLFAAVLYCHKAERSSAALEPYPVLLGRAEQPELAEWEGPGYRVPDFNWA
jgi:hypothetical protein